MWYVSSELPGKALGGVGLRRGRKMAGREAELLLDPAGWGSTVGRSAWSVTALAGLHAGHLGGVTGLSY